MKGMEGAKERMSERIMYSFRSFVPLVPLISAESSKRFPPIVVCGIATVGSIERTNLDLDVGRPSRLSDQGR